MWKIYYQLKQGWKQVYDSFDDWLLVMRLRDRPTNFSAYFWKYLGRMDSW
jgi:hypothetical protein